MTLTSSTRKFSYFDIDEVQCDRKDSTNSSFSNEDWSDPGWYRPVSSNRRSGPLQTAHLDIVKLVLEVGSQKVISSPLQLDKQ